MRLIRRSNGRVYEEGGDSECDRERERKAGGGEVRGKMGRERESWERNCESEIINRNRENFLSRYRCTCMNSITKGIHLMG